MIISWAWCDEILLILIDDDDDDEVSKIDAQVGNDDNGIEFISWLPIILIYVYIYNLGGLEKKFISVLTPALPLYFYAKK